MNKKSLFVIVLAALLLAACGGNGQEAAPVAQPVPEEQEPVIAEEAPVAEEEAPVVEEPKAENTANLSGMTDYTSPENIFNLEIPADWSYAKDDSTIKDSVIETYTSPDGNAFVQTLVNTTSIDTSAVLKGEYTLDYMRRLYGSDLKVAKDVLLDDGREKLTWWSEESKTSGTTYFDMQDNYLFFVSTACKDAYENDYNSTLEDIADSFTY